MTIVGPCRENTVKKPTKFIDRSKKRVKLTVVMPADRYLWPRQLSIVVNRLHIISSSSVAATATTTIITTTR